MRPLRLVHSAPAPHSVAGARLEGMESETSSPVEDPPFDPLVQALLKDARIIRPLPRAVRLRALARARAALEALAPESPRASAVNGRLACRRSAARSFND